MGSNESLIQEIVKIDATLSGLGYPFDIIVISSEWFEERRKPNEQKETRKKEKG